MTGFKKLTDPNRIEHGTGEFLPSPREIAMWAMALAGFTLALFLSYLSTQQSSGGDLRFPAVLAVDALVGAISALVYAIRRRTLTKTGVWWCYAYGLWVSAIFRLVPPIMQGEFLFNRNLQTVDVPYVLLGAAIHLGFVMLIAYPYARPAVLGQYIVDENDDVLKMSATSLFVFLAIAAIVRLVVDYRI